MSYRDVSPPTAAELARRREVASRARATPEIPRSTEAEFDAMAERRLRRLAAAPKERITIMVDRDVLSIFRSHGRGYQTRINNELRRIAMREVAGDSAEALLAEARHQIERAEARLRAVGRVGSGRSRKKPAP